MPRAKVLIVEDEAIVRALVSSNLTNMGYEVRSASSAAEARKISDEFNPDVYCLDIELGQGATGLDLAHAIQIANPNAAIVFLTNIPEPRFIGADSNSIPRKAAYLYKQTLSDPGELSYAIESVLRNSVNSSLRDDKHPKHALKNISRSQIDVLQMVALGMSNLEIASARGTSLRAVENLINRACSAANIEGEFGTNQRVKAARMFIKVAGMPQPK